jgi:hypothetical protein
VVAWSAIKPALITLFTDLALTQVAADEDDANKYPRWEAEWEGRKKAHISPQYHQALWLKVTSVIGVGVDETRYADITTDDGPDLSATQSGLRRIILQVQSRCTEYEDDGSIWCMQTLERIRTRLRRPSSLAALDAVGCSLIKLERAIDVSFKSDQHIWSAGNLDVVLGCAVNDTDPVPAGWIERIELTSHFQNNGVDIPSPPNVTADVIPEVAP